MNITTIQWDTVQESTLETILKQAPKTVLYFYPKNDTPWCTVEANDFTALADKFKELDTQIVGVSKDNSDSHCAFIKKYSLAPTYISDPSFKLHKQFGAYGEKNNYGKIVTGVIRSTAILASDWTVIHQWNNVRAKGHADRVYNYLLNQ